MKKSEAETYAKYGIVVIKEGLSTNGCKEVKKSVPTALVLKQREMVNISR